MRSLALLACVLGSAALDACINPCPRRQLMTYVAHTQGGRTKGVDVAARVDAADDWRVVGKVAAADASAHSRRARTGSCGGAPRRASSIGTAPPGALP